MIQSPRVCHLFIRQVYLIKVGTVYVFAFIRPSGEIFATKLRLMVHMKTKIRDRVKVICI